MTDAELVSLIRRLDALEQIKHTQVQSNVVLHFGRPKQGLSPTAQDGEADSDGASISVATVVSPAAAAAVTVPIREGKADEGTSLIVAEV